MSDEPLSLDDDKPKANETRRKIVLVASLVAVFVLVAVSLSGGGSRSKSSSGPAKKVYTREELRAAVVGKTTDEVLAILGKPNRTSDSSVISWTYDEISRDPVSGKIDYSATLWIEGGRIGSVDY